MYRLSQSITGVTMQVSLALEESMFSWGSATPSGVEQQARSTDAVCGARGMMRRNSGSSQGLSAHSNASAAMALRYAQTLPRLRGPQRINVAQRWPAMALRTGVVVIASARRCFIHGITRAVLH